MATHSSATIQLFCHAESYVEPQLPGLTLIRYV